MVMKGGITSAVIYPSALHAIGAAYRIRNIGGASAGAIGAAAGAAAEYGRTGGGYERLRAVPGDLGGRLAGLFQPQEATSPLLAVMLAANGADRPGPRRSGRRRMQAVVATLLRGFPMAVALGTVPGAALAVVGVVAGGLAGWLLFASGLVLGVVGAGTALAVGLARMLTRAVPANMFGICRGHPGLTDWLCDQIDAIAGLPLDGPPLTFGQLWAGPDETGDDPERQIDLRMITTCLSEGRPYELPWEARHFFFDPEEWRGLFPDRVVDALEAVSGTAPPEGLDGEGVAFWSWENRSADEVGVSRDKTQRRRRLRFGRLIARRGASDAANLAEDRGPRRLRRLPQARDLPVIVATRLSLSFPLLISAVPLWTVDRRAKETETAVNQYRAAHRAKAEPRPSQLRFSRVWFTDGGFCSNFPVHLFDAALPTRPTFAINLSGSIGGREPMAGEGTKSQGPGAEYGAKDQGTVADDDAESHVQDPVAAERNNIGWERSNRRPLRQPPVAIPTEGLPAVLAFASAALNTSRNWQDSSHLDHPGYRDRIVRVLQSKSEGGINLHMEADTIGRLVARGQAAGEVLVEFFTQPRDPARPDRGTGWDNHRWVRFRALLSVLPDWIESYANGKRVLDINPASPPSYSLTDSEQVLAERMTAALDAVAEAVKTSDDEALDSIESAPSPKGILRRIPRT